MSENRESNKPGSPHLGPVTPPSLGEVYEISTRRQRTRYRLIQGSLVAVAVAGVGVGIQSRGGDSIQTPADGGQEAAAEGTDSETDGDSGDQPNTSIDLNNPEGLDTSEDGAIPTADPVECPTPQFASDPVDWMIDGRAVYLESSTVPTAELETLAAQWQIPYLEVKGLVGVAGEVDATLVGESIDEAFFDWYEEGYTADQLGSLAAEWNVSTISVKVLQLLGGPVADASFAECGLS